MLLSKYYSTNLTNLILFVIMTILIIESKQELEHNSFQGDHWNHFLNILNTGEKITKPLTGIAANVVQVGTAGTSLKKLFDLDEE